MKKKQDFPTLITVYSKPRHLESQFPSGTTKFYITCKNNVRISDIRIFYKFTALVLFVLPFVSKITVNYCMVLFPDVSFCCGKWVLKHMWVRQKYQVYPKECLLIVTRLHIKCFPHKILYEKKYKIMGKMYSTTFLLTTQI